MRFLFCFCAAVLAAASALVPSGARAAPGTVRPDPALAAITAPDGLLVEPVQYYHPDRRDWRRREAMRRRAEARRRAEMRRRAEGRRRHGYR